MIHPNMRLKSTYGSGNLNFKNKGNPLNTQSNIIFFSFFPIFTAKNDVALGYLMAHS
jgi:hypothetical protein